VVALFVGARFVADRGGSAGLSLNSGANPATGGGATEMTAGSAAPQAAPGQDAVAGTGSSASRGSATGSAKSSIATPGPEPMTAPVPAVITPPLGPGEPSGFVAPANTLVGRPVFLTFGSATPDRAVWRFSGWLRNTPSNILVKVGTVNARLGAGGRPVARTVYEKLGDSSQKFVWWADDDYQVYRPVTMRLQGDPTAYWLVSSGAVPDWGFWPAWPRTVAPYPATGAVPGRPVTSADGAVVYLAGSTPAATGFAVGPASKADPVARIPKWTWYSRTVPTR
jgi:hypothetical protein